MAMRKAGSPWASRERPIIRPGSLRLYLFDDAKALDDRKASEVCELGDYMMRGKHPIINKNVSNDKFCAQFWLKTGGAFSKTYYFYLYFDTEEDMSAVVNAASGQGAADFTDQPLFGNHGVAGAAGGSTTSAADRLKHTWARAIHTPCT